MDERQLNDNSPDDLLVHGVPELNAMPASLRLECIRRADEGPIDAIVKRGMDEPATRELVQRVRATDERIQKDFWNVPVPHSLKSGILNRLTRETVATPAPLEGTDSNSRRMRRRWIVAASMLSLAASIAIAIAVWPRAPERWSEDQVAIEARRIFDQLTNPATPMKPQPDDVAHWPSRLDRRLLRATADVNFLDCSTTAYLLRAVRMPEGEPPVSMLLLLFPKNYFPDDFSFARNSSGHLVVSYLESSDHIVAITVVQEERHHQWFEQSEPLLGFWMPDARLR